MRPIRVAPLVIIGCLLTASGFSAELVTIEKEIDDDHIIISRDSGERLLLEKWTLRFSPLVFEGKTLPADVSPMWVTIYFEDRDPIKWSIEERLGGGRVRSAEFRQSSSPRVTSRDALRLVQAGLSALNYDTGTSDSTAGEETTDAIRAFQDSEKLPQDGRATRATLLALSAELCRRFPENQQVLDLASALLAVASPPPSVEEPPLMGTDAIESYIKGEFEGWDGETVFFLDNGQIWQQSSYAYTYHYAYHPKVTIFKTRGAYKMLVDGVSGSIYVTRIK